MTASSRTSLKTRFSTGAVPDGSDFGDFIDSFVNITDTTAQSTGSTLSTQGFTTTILSADSAWFNDLRVTNIVGTSATIGNLVATSATVTNGTVTTLASTSANITTAYILTSQIDALTSTLVSAITVNSQRVSASAMFLTGSLGFGSAYETTAKASAGTANALPTSAHGFLAITVNGVSMRIPYFRS